LKRIGLLLLFLLVILGALFWDSYTLFLNPPPLPNPEVRIVHIVPGMGLPAVADRLTRDGVIQDPKKFMILAWWKRVSKRIQWGDFELYQGMPPAQVLNYLTTGKNMLRKVTIPEGFTLQQIAQRLEEEKLVEARAFIALARDPVWVEGLGLEGTSLEGYLFPDTYFFPRGITSEKIQKKMVDQFKKVLAGLPPGGSPPVPLSLKETVILASIVERESGLSRERPLIASVFYNRLRKGMPLQSDPTVIYGLDHFDGDLKKKDLLRPTSYNTYCRTGLPVGPIANPGRDSLQAVLSPARSDYLYFVSKNDGSHYFSEKLSDHNRAVGRYQLSRREVR
jgi:UPF0755 protein